MNFPYGEGAGDYTRAQAAYKKKDWAAVAEAAQAAIKKDAMHLDAHRLLATALAQQGDRTGARDHLIIALAGDLPKYAAGLATDQDLADFMKSPEGNQVRTAAGAMQQSWTKAFQAMQLVIGRRSTFKLPAKSGYASSRGELYAFDPDGPRFLRITHTDDQVIAWLPSPSGAEITVIGFDKLELAATPDVPTLLGRTWIETYDPHTLQPTGKRATVPSARAVGVYYAAGDDLIAIAYPAKGRWDRGDGVAYSIDRTTGKATKVKAPAPTGAQALVSLDEGAIDATPPGIDATWAGDPPAAAELGITPPKAPRKSITVPESGKAPRAGVAVSPGGTRVAFATWADPCATDGSLPSLYVFDGTNGKLEHILTAPSRFGARWIDDTRLVYEDDDGGLRVYDATAGHEVLHVSERGGLALRALSLSAKPICKTAPPPPPPTEPGTGSGSGSGSASGSSEDPMPPSTP
jgi:hypothetical protein